MDVAGRDKLVSHFFRRSQVLNASLGLKLSEPRLLTDGLSHLGQGLSTALGFLR